MARRLAVSAAVVFVLMAATAGWIALSRGGQGHVSIAAEGPCTVQLFDHKMNATVEGPGAGDVCSSWLHGGSLASGPTGNLQCTYARDGLVVSVHDEGNAYYGFAFCTHLQAWSSSGGAVPDLSSDSAVPLPASPS